MFRRALLVSTSAFLILLAVAASGWSRPIVDTSPSRQRAGALLTVPSACERQGEACTNGLIDFYAQTAWPTIHRDSANSDFSPFVTPSANRVAWTALDGAATLLAPSIGPEGNLYVTTGRGPGTSHLHAFDRDGRLLWESDPQVTLDDLDSGAIGSAPVIGEAGEIYVADSNQFWALHSDGSVKWVVDLPDADTGFATAIITKEGLVGGVATNGKVVLFDRSDGSLAVPILDLPGGPGPTGPAVIEGMWGGGLMDPRIVQTVFDAFFGFGLEVTNTPAVHPKTGRIYITATAAEPDQGVLYGIDLANGELSIAFEAPIGGGSGTSPAISHDGARLYAVGGDDIMVAFDAETGDLLWSAGGAGAAASPAVGPDETVYSGAGEFVLALDPDDGSVKWSANYDALASSFLRRIVPNDAFPTGLPIARVNSVVSVSAAHLWVVLALGYEFDFPDSELTLPQPHLVVLVSLDPSNGALQSVTRLRDSNEGTAVVGDDGRMYVCHAAWLTSTFFFAVNPELPERLQIPGPPIGGLTALEPVSFLDHVRSGVRWVRRLDASALTEISRGACDAASTALCRGASQLTATADSIRDDTGEELDPATAAVARELVLQARDDLDAANSVLGSDVDEATARIADAEAALGRALTELVPMVYLDILPGACPNAVSRRPPRWAKIEVAVAGTPTFEVWRVNLASLRLSRADGVGGTIRPGGGGLIGRQPIRFADVVTPVAGDLCGCSAPVADGIMDRVLTFSAAELVSSLKLRSVAAGEPVPIQLTGLLIDGTPFRGMDCLTVSPKLGSRK